MFKSIPLDWKRVPLASLGKRVSRRNTIANTNVLTISAVHGLVNQKTFFKKIVASANLSNYFLLKNGEFAYNKSYSNGYPVGVVRRLDKYEAGVLSPLYICFDISSNRVDQNFAVHFFDSYWFISEINEIAKEGARNHGLLNVGIGEFFALSFILPPPRRAAKNRGHFDIGRRGHRKNARPNRQAQRPQNRHDAGAIDQGHWPQRVQGFPSRTHSKGVGGG